MIKQSLVVSVSVLAASLLAACGGGGTAPTTPSTAGNAPIAAKPTAPPASTIRKSVGSARYTLKLPNALQARGASVHARNAAAVAGRLPKYVNPGVGNNVGLNILDVYVDNTLIANTDGNFPNNDHTTLVQNNSGDGTLNGTIPLYSTTNNTIVAVEWDPSDTDILAIGEYNAGAISPGTTTNVSLTMQMQAYYVGIVDLPNLDDPEILLGQNYYASYSGTPNNANDDPQFICYYPPSSNAFALYTADAELTLVPIAGYGGTSTPTITSSPPTSQSHIAQSPLGTYFVAFDGNCTSVPISATAPNPAYALYADIAAQYPFVGYDPNNSQNHAYYDGYNNGAVNGPYQGIWNLWWIGPLSSQLNQLSNSLAGPTGTPGVGSITIVGSNPG